MDKNVKNGILHIIRSQNENGLYICPNCGAEQTLDELLDGCDYCKTRFDISAYDDKVMSVMRNKSTFDTREGNTFATLIWIAVVVMGVSCAGTGIVLLLPTFGLSLIVLIIGIGIICLGIWGALKSVKNTERNTRWKYQLQDNSLGFSEEEFIGSLDCKLKSIHYASVPQELSAFVKCDIAPFVNSYQSIINCEIGKISFKDYRLEGGKCKYCGNEMDYATYDWIVVDYKHVNVL